MYNNLLGYYYNIDKDICKLYKFFRNYSIQSWSNHNHIKFNKWLRQYKYNMVIYILNINHSSRNKLIYNYN